MSQTIIDIPLRTILRIIAVIATVGFLFVIRDILLLFLFAIVLASGIAPIISWFERRGVPRLLGLIFIILVAFASLVILLYAVIPPLLREFQDFAKNFPTYARMVLLGLRPIGIEPASPIGQGVSQGLQQLAQLLGRGVSLLPAVTIQLFGGIFTTASLLLVTFYLSLDRDGVEKLIRLFVPVDEESYILDLWRRSQRKIGSWARGQILLMLLVGVLTYVGLSLLKVHYTLLLSIVAGIFELVPVVGPVMAGAAAVAVAIFQSPALALFVLVFAVLLQQIENHFIVPLLYRRILGLNPVIVIFALLIGGKLGGIVGIVLAVPIVAVVMEFLGDYTKGKVRL